jgi:glucose-6-phosphate isomerase
MTDSLVQRIWSKDGSAWTDDPAAQRFIPTALGWLDVVEQMAGRVEELEALAAEVRQAGFTNVFLLGMGGSSLCPEVLRQTFGSKPGYPTLTVLDTTHPDAIRAAERRADPARTLFLVSSKSGGTTETLSLFRYFFGRVQALKGERAGESFIALTDPGTRLEKLAAERRFRRVIATPPDVGGRYSALTDFGLVPAALIGLELRELLTSARAMVHECRNETPDDNPGLALGRFLGTHALQGRDKVTLLMPPAIASFGLWVEQLLAESTGKEGKGLIPIASEPLGPPSVYGDDRVFVYLWVDAGPDQPIDDEAGALEAAGRPTCELELRDRLDLGAEFFRWEFATAVAGALLRINAFDQPNVQESKDNTDAVLADYARSGSLPTAESASDDAVAALLRRATAGDYVAIMAYLPPSAETGAALRGIRTSIRDGLRVATTVGYGPRFLHSTGQLHKGGPNSGLFIQIVADPEEGLEIPGEPYTFATLIRAQALGDLRSLAAHGRRAIRVDLGRDVAGGLARLQRVVDSAVRVAR